MIPAVLAIAAFATVTAAVMVLRLSIQGRIGLGIWDIPLAFALTVLGGVLLGAAIALWRMP